MATFQTPCQVTVHALNARPDLNGRRGRADSFDVQTGRYLVTIDGSGEQVALRAANLTPEAPPQPPPAAGGGGGGMAGGGGGGMPAIEPRFAGICVTAALVFLLEVSLLAAAAVGGVVFLLMSAARQPGGVRVALGSFAGSIAGAFERVTGTRITPAQAGFLVVVSAILIWKLALGGSFGASRSSSGSGGYFGGSGGNNRRRTSGHDDYGGGGGGMLGFGSGVDLSFLIGAGMLGSMVYRLGGGGRPGGWTVGNFVRGVQNMDMFQLMMFVNLVQQVLGGGRRRGGYGGYGGGFGGRRMYY